MSNFRTLLAVACLVAAGAALPVAAYSQTAEGSQVWLVRSSSTLKNAAANVPPGITLDSATLPNSRVSGVYMYDLKPLTHVVGGKKDVSAVVYTFVGGLLPNGVSVSSDGVISGTVARPARYAEFSIQATYMNVTTQQTYKILPQ
ncbi:putative Ig domain-containing protein [Acidovorax sp. sic0104]|uniref:putative Ig domain-containing protein n=1 Tax=Acidovorax sp. sic0104 TaxID=2854784 RepID=UPI001C492136|nr:putative Ig domain-containing protein [Acidovorax sp. sic0104]MBV7542041.1 hypothetical protein [Acidovorax sp. sic0104]